MLGDYGFVESFFTKAGEVVKQNSDFISYWCQLNISLAIAVERYILIVKATNAEELLSKPRRRKLYCLIILWISFPPIFFFAVHFSYFNEVSVFRIQKLKYWFLFQIDSRINVYCYQFSSFHYSHIALF